jgi:hypothetical protein
MPNDGQPVLRAGDPCAERRRGAVRPLLPGAKRLLPAAAAPKPTRPRGYR